MKSLSILLLCTVILISCKKEQVSTHQEYTCACVRDLNTKDTVSKRVILAKTRDEARKECETAQLSISCSIL